MRNILPIAIVCFLAMSVFGQSGEEKKPRRRVVAM